MARAWFGVPTRCGRRLRLRLSRPMSSALTPCWKRASYWRCLSAFDGVKPSRSPSWACATLTAPANVIAHAASSPSRPRASGTLIAKPPVAGPRYPYPGRRQRAADTTPRRARAKERGSATGRSAPDALGDLDDAPQLGELVIAREVVALLGRREPAL